MTNKIWEQLIHPLANFVGDISRAAEVKLPIWIKHRMVEKLYWVYKRRWRSWKEDHHGQQVLTGGEDSTCCYFDCDENGNNHNAAMLAEDRIQDMIDCDCFQTTLSVSVSVSTTGDSNNHTPRRARRKRRDSILSLREPVTTPIRSVFPGSIPVNDVQLTRLLGSGGFGTVYYGLLEDETPVAVKKMHACRKNMKAKEESFRAELKVLQLKHPNIVRTLAASDPVLGTEDEDIPDATTSLLEAYIIMEYTGERNLQQIINDNSEILDIQRRISFSLQLTNALQYVHNQHIVHLDIKPANIMICDDDTVKLADFGCCRAVETDTGSVSPTQRSYLTGTFAYRAPELLRGEQPSTKADIYSLGITLWQMLSRDMPYNGQNQHVVIFGVVAYNLRPNVDIKPKIDQTPEVDSVSTSGERTLASGEATEEDPIETSFYRDLFIQCWQSDPRDRPVAADLVEVFTIWKMYL